MKKQEVVRLYKFADATLVTKGLEKTAYMMRDKNEFETYGITTIMINELSNELNVFSERLTDVEALGDQTLVTEAKDAKAEEIRMAVRDIMARVVLVYPVGSPKYKKFGTEALSQISDADLLIVARRVARVGTEYLTDLAGHGVTAALLAGLTTKADEFTDLIVDLKLEIAVRDIEQEDRVEAGNAIYKTLEKYTSLGQSIWESTDVAKFNDYVLYNTISGEEEVPAPTP